MRHNRADFAVAAGRPENFFVEKCGNPLDFRPEYKYNSLYHEKKKETAAYRREASKLKKLLTDGMVIEGTLSEIRSGTAVHYQLTRKVNGRTRTDYVPLDMKAEVADWTRRWKSAKALLKGLSDFSRSILRHSCGERAKTGGRSSSRSGGARPPSSRTPTRRSAR